MAIVAILSGAVLAVVVFLLLSASHWQRLLGLAFLSDALALLAVAAGGVSAYSMSVAVCLALIGFALFLAGASFARTSRRPPFTTRQRTEEHEPT